MNIGEKINQLRKKRGMTLMELANASRVAQATLSRIENGRMSGTVESHASIAEALGISLPELYSNVDIAQREIVYQKATDNANTFLHGDNGRAFILTKNTLRKKMLPVLLEIKPGGIAPVEEDSADTEKFIYCLEGQIEIVINEQVYNLGVGDSFYFNASLKHQIANKAESVSKCIIISSPPAL